MQRRSFVMDDRPLGQVALDPNFQASLHVAHYPCWFYRLVQRLLLGVYWRKVD